MEFDAGKRAYLNEMRMLSTDSAGNEIFVGLTVEESREYSRYINDLRPGSAGDSEAADRYLELHEKHESARRAVLLAENEARHDKPPLH
jgi:hypothetical protein